MADTVGLLGVGRMGREIGPRLAEGGYPVVAYDVSEEARQRASGWAQIAASPADVAQRASVVILLVATDKQCLHAVAGPDGLLQEAGQDLLIVVSSSVLPTTMMDLDRQARGRGATVIDGPLCRGEKAAREGDLLVYLGGDEAACERATPVFRAFCSDVIRVGDLGAGQIAKMANNALLWANMMANNEMYRLAERYGMDVELLRQALLAGSGANWAMAHPENLRSIPWAAKDMEGLRREAERLDLALPVSMVVREEVSEMPGVVRLSELHDE